MLNHPTHNQDNAALRTPVRGLALDKAPSIDRPAPSEGYAGSGLSAPKNSGLKFNLLQTIARITRKHRPRGTERFLRWIYSPDTRQHDHFSIAMPYDANLLINVDSASFIEWSLFFYGHYEPELVSLIKRLFRPGFVAFDVGANIGCQALIMGSLTGAEGKVIAVEPHPKVFGSLVENVQLNRLTNIKPLRCALSDARGRAVLHSFAECDTNRGASSLYAANIGEQAVEISVEVRTLDEVVQAENLSRLDFVKIDTEGGEPKVLLGAQESIKRYRPYIIFEYDETKAKGAGCDFSFFKDFFSRMPYSMYVVQPGNLTKVEYGLPNSTNVLAVPDWVMTDEV